jgi:hypothetical protein
MADAGQIRLMAGETMVWKGAPHAGLLLRPIEIFLIPFTLLWAGFAVFWNVTVWTSDTGPVFTLFGIPFLIVGLYATIGRFVLDILLRRATRYAVTNQRIVISRGSKTTSLDIRHLPALELSEHGDGSGTIRFGPAISLLRANNNFGIWQPSLDPTPQFIRVPNVRSVYALIRKQAEA